MTQNKAPTGGPCALKRLEGAGQQVGELEIGRPSPERMRAANEVGSAIVHQLNGPITALRLYVGELRESCGRSNDATRVSNDIRQMVEAAFQETEQVCAMMRAIADTFEQPLYPETAAAFGSNVINWWLRRDRSDGTAAPASFAALTRREREVLNHVSQGCSNKQGAIRMQIGPRTFESHRARLMRKLGARNAADLVRIALGENPEAS
jgi:DNA-binding CsgD family transcriptional regulator